MASLPVVAVRRGALSAAGTRVGLAAICLLVCMLGGRDLANEAAVSLQGDVPKYLMNGAYMLDVARDHPLGVQTLVDYTRHYYARYPALSLGHHPPLVSALDVPAFAIFGVSVRSARFVQLVSVVAAVVGLFLLVQRRYGSVAALVAALLFATSPAVVEITQAVLSEMPTLALVVWSAYFLQEFCLTERRTAIVGFAACAALSLYGKQLAIFVFPAYAIAAVRALGIRRLLRRDVIIAGLVMIVAVLPLIPMTLVLSRSNVNFAMRGPNPSKAPGDSILWAALSAQLSLPVIFVSAAGLVTALVRRDGKALLLLAWVGSVAIGLLLAGRFDPPRHGVYWIPALCALGASTVTIGRNRLVTGAVIVAALAAAGGQAMAARALPALQAEGYEDAARFVLASNPGPTVLFSGDVDTGFFTFFVRKHDADRRLVVLRSDKVLTTSYMGRPSVADRVGDVAGIYEVLHRFGVRYVVIEDVPSRSRVLEWLRQETHSSRFAERWRQPIATTDRRLRGASLAVYELLDARAPDPDAVLSMDLPIIGESVTVKLSDLMARKYFR
jgi:hypothetical protein